MPLSGREQAISPCQSDWLCVCSVLFSCQSVYFGTYLIDER